MRYLIIIIIMLLTIVQAQNSVASPASEALVAEGRVLFFDSNNLPPYPTYTGLIAANEKFKSAVAEDATDELAHLFYAVTRVMVSYIEQGDTAEIETVRELLEAFGLSRTLEDSRDFFPYSDLPGVQGTYTPPATTPSGEELQSFLADDVIALIDSAIGNLAAITSQSFTTTLTIAETGDLFPVEIDYGDVLYVKSLLYSFKAAIQIFAAYDMNINLRDTLILANAGVLQLQRDLLDKYTSFLSLHTDGATLLTSAKANLFLAINTYRLAFDFITAESDDQNDDFFSFGSGEEVAEAYAAIMLLNELKNSLNENRTFTETETEWLLTDGNSNQIELSIIEDHQGNFIEGSFYGVFTCSFLFCDGWVSDIAVNGSTITVDVGFGDFCPGTATLTGTVSGDSITGGTYSGTDCSGPLSGTFTGTEQYSDTDSFLDMNALFGNTGKSPLDIRAILPTFDADGDMLAGTFPTPYFNNLIPSVTREIELVNEFDLPVVYEVQPGTITLDGSEAEWTVNHTVAEDDVDDIYWDAPSGNNIDMLYAARDSSFFYWMMSLNDSPVDASTGYTLETEGETINKLFRSSIWNGTYSLYSYDEFWTPQLISSDPNNMGAVNVIEARIPIDQFDGTTKIFARGWSGADFIDDTILKLPNDAELTGTISSVDFTGSGKIFIYVYDGMDPYSSELLGTAVLDNTGSYTVTGLPIGKEVFVIARWDADDNGILTIGDYVGNSGLTPVEILSSGTQSNITIATEVLIKNSQLFSQNIGFSDFLTSIGYGNYYAMAAGITSDSSDRRMYIQSSSIISELAYIPLFDLVSDPYFLYRKTFSTSGGYNPPGYEWEGMDYTFFVDNNANATLDIDEVPLLCDIPYGGIRQMDIPVVTVTGGSLPTISWLPVIDAVSYRISFREITDSNQFGDILFSTVIEEDGSPSYSYTYDGDLFSQYDMLAIVVRAKDEVSDCFFNRSLYFTTHSGPSLTGGIFAENRAYSEFFSDFSDYYEMRGWAKSDGNNLPIYAQNIPHTSGPSQVEIPYLSSLDLLSDPLFIFSKKFSAADGFSLPGADWEGGTFPIYLDENENGALDVGEQSLDWTIPVGSLQQLDIPVVSITGRLNPTLSWQEVQAAERYQIRFWTVTEENSLGDVLYSTSISADGSPSYSYTYDGDLFSQHSTLAITVMADDTDSGFYNRSTYVTTHSIPNVNLTGMILLLLD